MTLLRPPDVATEAMECEEPTCGRSCERGVFFDQFHADGPNRERGSRGLLDALGAHLA